MPPVLIAEVTAALPEDDAAQHQGLVLAEAELVV
jgi:hypothetical protein